MPTIDQLPPALASSDTDELAVSQTGISLSTVPPLVTELVTETGAPIVDQFGNPLFIES